MANNNVNQETSNTPGKAAVKKEAPEVLTKEDEMRIDASYLPEGLIEVPEEEIKAELSKQKKESKLAKKFKSMLGSMGLYRLGSYLLSFFALNYFILLTFKSAEQPMYVASSDGIRIVVAMLVCIGLAYFCRKRLK